MDAGSGMERPRRKGLHRFFHVSKTDRYASAVLAVAFFALAVLKVIEVELGFLTWLSAADSLQLALLFGIFGIVADIYFRMYEARYDKR